MDHNQLNKMFGRECAPLGWKSATKECADLEKQSVCEWAWVYDILIGSTVGSAQVTL